MSHLILAKTTIHCNRCDQAFEAPKDLPREGFAGQKAARIETFCTCPHCGQTDCHWLYANDVMPKFDGNFEARKRATMTWLLAN